MELGPGRIIQLMLIMECTFSLRLGQSGNLDLPFP